MRRPRYSFQNSSSFALVFSITPEKGCPEQCGEVYPVRCGITIASANSALDRNIDEQKTLRGNGSTAEVPAQFVDNLVDKEPSIVLVDATAV